MGNYLKRFVLLAMLFVLVSSTIYLGSLDNYANQDIPEYITEDNTGSNQITDLEATLGRVLFYDKQLSTDKNIACASCHIQEYAFGDTSLVSTGVNGLTGRHSMRLINSRFTNEEKFFWDERANTLEEQTTMPIQDHAEMGYSGQNGAPSIDDLILELNQLTYYQELCLALYGDAELNETRMQRAIAQFIRSIQSFDSKYDEGRELVAHDSLSFPNFTPSENRGKSLYLRDPIFGEEGNRIDGGVGCASCHVPPGFSIDPDTRNNGVVTEVDGTLNFQIKKSPTLRDLFNPETSQPNGPFMHNSQFGTFAEVINHYNTIGFLPAQVVTQVDPRLRSASFGQKLNMTQEERQDLRRFMLTLTGQAVYTDQRWSDPFDENGFVEIVDGVTSIEDHSIIPLALYPNPASDFVDVRHPLAKGILELLNEQGHTIARYEIGTNQEFVIDVSDLKNGVYFVRVANSERSLIEKLVVCR